MLAQPAAWQSPLHPSQVIVDMWAEGADWPELARELEAARSAQRRWLEDRGGMRVLVDGVLRSLQMDEQVALIERLGFLGFQARCRHEPAIASVACRMLQYIVRSRQALLVALTQCGGAPGAFRAE